ncbi:entericidin A/B family lipoprotein [Maricaulis sp. CAU 1757]
MKRATSAILIALLTLSVAACNTIYGAGRDVEEAGETVQDAAD